jgi:purine-nucleoside phosphorylase
VTSTLERVTGRREHRVAIVLGSGLSELARSLLGDGAVPYTEVPGMPVSTVAGHQGALYSGSVEGVATVAFAGRVHLYEGRSAREVVRPVELAVEAGCETVVLTNAAGGIRSDLRAGECCLLSDHLNLTGANPLFGPPDGRGPRFLDLSDTYDPGLRERARAIDPELKEGVYAGLTGPTYETPAEVRMLATLGADLVGMSTVLEAITARYLGARVLGISVITNPAAGLTEEPLSHDDVADAGRRAVARLEELLRGVLRGMA